MRHDCDVADLAASAASDGAGRGHRGDRSGGRRGRRRRPARFGAARSWKPAAAACDRGDWSSAVAIAEAAAALDPEAPEVVDLLARASTGAGTGGRRRLTVMFCDLVGSTEISSALDPEDTRELLHAYYDACSEIVREHDGHIGQFLGDGVLIYFGYPRAHEDDGLRAVLTGLAIADAVSRLRAPTGDAAVELNVRIGIHTGLAVISGADGGSRTRPGEVIGETPNLAARVQTAAPTGSVVVSADTLQLVADRVDARPLGAHSLKGIDRPVELFEVLSVRSDDDGADDAPRTLTVGRAAERATLERAWLDASEQSSYVVITGEPGIGKSHLVRYTRGLVPEGGRSLVLRCSALHTNTPLYPVVQLLRSPRGPAGDGDGDDPLARLARVAGSVGDPSDENLYLLAQICSVPVAGRSHGPRPPGRAGARAHADAPLRLDRRARARGPPAARRRGSPLGRPVDPGPAPALCRGAGHAPDPRARHHAPRAGHGSRGALRGHLAAAARARGMP